MNTLSALGNSQEMHAAMDRHLLLCEPKSAEPKSVEFCINTAGEITGSYLDVNNAYHRFVYDANGTRTEFDAPGEGTGGGRRPPKDKTLLTTERMGQRDCADRWARFLMPTFKRGGPLSSDRPDYVNNPPATKKAASRGSGFLFGLRQSTPVSRSGRMK